MRVIETVQVELEGRGYPIHIGGRLLAEAGAYIAPLLRGKRAVVVTDRNVAPLYLHRLMGSLEQHGIGALPVVLPAGEQSKSFPQLETLLETILEYKPDRATCLIALGGGVIGDLTGFAASIILRGVPFIQIPTTLLSQVDSSVGGKTGINSRFGKNLIGSFYQPRLVLADVGTLATLPARELRAGYAEVAKYAFIRDAVFFGWLQEHGQRLLAGDAQALAHAIAVSCRAKAAVVAADEREQGERALLNFGHTFAHALEAETGYGQELLHGEAVAAGMVLAFALSARLGFCAPEAAATARAHLEACGLPGTLAAIRPRWDAEALLEHMSRDKKAKDGKLTFVLARGIGDAFVAEGVAADDVRAVLRAEGA